MKADFINTEVAGAAISVSELTQGIKTMLEEGYPSLLVEGEVSNFKVASSGHWYFSLKDEQAMIQAVLFRRTRSAFTPADGQMVRVRASLSLYAKRGAYQLVCSHIEDIGEGRILQQIEERKRRLAAEGLFNAEHKKPIPFFPRRVVVLSSERGAALHDIIQILRRRAPWLSICVVNIPVQGSEAAQQIARRLSIADSLGDVIILSRGGGSLEDLLPFSAEEVVRSVFACTTPVISAVGHEIDWALSDFVADLRAPTPSAAAEMLCNNADELHLRILTAGRIIIQAFAAIRDRLAIALRPFRQEKLEQSFRSCIQPHKLAIDDYRQSLCEAMRGRHSAYVQRLEIALRELEACNPYSVLERGYAMVWNKEGAVATGIENISLHENISIQFHNGRAGAEVQEIRDTRKSKENTTGERTEK